MKWISVDAPPDVSGRRHVIWEYTNDGHRAYGHAEFDERFKEWTDPDDDEGYMAWLYPELAKQVVYWLHFEYPPMPPFPTDINHD